MDGTTPDPPRAEGSGERSPLAVALGDKLRQLREAIPGKPSIRAVAAELEWGHATLSRFETGSRLAGTDHVEKLLALYENKGLEIEDRVRDDILALASGQETSPWLATSVPEQRIQLDTLIKLEQKATTITNWSPLLVPGLCQTQEYTRAMMQRGEVPGDEIETRVAVRIGRQHAIMRRNNPANMLALIKPGVLRARIGGPEVMAGQLRFLEELAQRSNVDLRIVPDETDFFPGLEGPFLLLEFADRTPVAHLEARRSGLFFHQAKDVAAYETAAEKVLREAMSPHDSVQIIAREAEQIEETIR
jgi:transcriptional regulator with XRE-family HTH domain